jgi:hypothetical protein
MPAKGLGVTRFTVGYSFLVFAREVLFIVVFALWFGATNILRDVISPLLGGVQVTHFAGVPERTMDTDPVVAAGLAGILALTMFTHVVFPAKYAVILSFPVFTQVPKTMW